jgi:hypothetical protein
LRDDIKKETNRSRPGNELVNPRIKEPSKGSCPLPCLPLLSQTESTERERRRGRGGAREGERERQTEQRKAPAGSERRERKILWSNRSSKPMGERDVCHYYSDQSKERETRKERERAA